MGKTSDEVIVGGSHLPVTGGHFGRDTRVITASESSLIYVCLAAAIKS